MQVQCEVCGSEIRGPPHYRVIEGGRMTVCARCASFGSRDWDPRERRAPVRRPRQRPRPRSEVEAAEGLELVEDYGEKIRKERQKRRLTVEEFAKQIQEKESVVKKLEKEELTPDRNLIRKLRNALGVELLVVGETAPAPVTGKPSRGRTLGDIMKLSQSTKKAEKEERD
jgi:putative transcription factor